MGYKTRLTTLIGGCDTTSIEGNLGLEINKHIRSLKSALSFDGGFQD